MDLVYFVFFLVRVRFELAPLSIHLPPLLPLYAPLAPHLRRNNNIGDILLFMAAHPFVHIPKKINYKYNSF
jgi:hypothetical protein